LPHHPSILSLAYTSMIRLHSAKGMKGRSAPALSGFGGLGRCDRPALHVHGVAKYFEGVGSVMPHNALPRVLGHKVAVFAKLKDGSDAHPSLDNDPVRDSDIEATNRTEPIVLDASRKTLMDLEASKLRLARWYLVETEKVQFLAVEGVLAVMFMGLLDGGFSGMHTEVFSIFCCLINSSMGSRHSAASHSTFHDYW
jgi:hypothetical protein